MKEVIVTFKHKIHLATKDFMSLEEIEVPISVVKVTSAQSDLDTRWGKNPVLFEAKYPEHIYQECVKLFPEEFVKKPLYNESGVCIMSENHHGKARIFRFATIGQVVDELYSYSVRLVTHHTHEEVYGEKVIFIFFEGETREERDGNFGGDMGISNNIEFQYFIGYRYIGKGQQWFNKDVDIEKYSAPYKRPRSKINADHDNDDGRTVCLHHAQKDLDCLKTKYLIIPYSEEREVYLKEIQKTFVTVTDKLNDFLKDLTEEKLDHLIATSPVLKMLQSPEKD